MIDAAPGAPPPDWPRAGDEIGAQNFGPFAQEALARYAAFPATTIPCISTRKQQRRQVSPAACAWHADALLFRTLDHGWRRDLFIARLSAKFLRPVLAGDGIRVMGRVLRSAWVPKPELILRLTARGRSDDLVILAEAAVQHKNANLIS